MAPWECQGNPYDFLSTAVLLIDALDQNASLLWLVGVEVLALGKQVSDLDLAHQVAGLQGLVVVPVDLDVRPLYQKLVISTLHPWNAPPPEVRSGTDVVLRGVQHSYLRALTLQDLLEDNSGRRQARERQVAFLPLSVLGLQESSLSIEEVAVVSPLVPLEEQVMPGRPGETRGGSHLLDPFLHI
jgi:hypothetical protein